MSFCQIINKLGEIFDQKGILPILIGGWAMNALGIIRQTFDFDIMILESRFRDVKNAIESLDYTLVFKNELFVKFKHNKNQLPDIDCLFSDEQTFEKIRETGKLIEIEGARFILPEPKNIIAMKLHSLKYGAKDRKKKDFDDIVWLIKQQNIDVSDENFKAFCLKYGNPEILEELKNEIKNNL